MSVQIPRQGGVKTEELYTLYEYLATKRVVHLYGYLIGHTGMQMSRTDIFNPNMVKDTLFAMAKEDPISPIHLIVDSPGGAIDDGLSLIDTMKLIPAPVYTYGHHCYSMAAVILSAGEPGHRYMFPNGRTMLHLPVTSTGSQDSNTLEKTSKAVTELKDLLVDILIDGGVKKTHKQVLKDIDRDFWLSASETVKYGVADYVLTKAQVNSLFFMSNPPPAPTRSVSSK